MSKRKHEHHNLGVFQRDLLIHIAENEPYTINQVKEKLGKDYKQVHTAHTKLQELGLLRQADTRSYRGREFIVYWLSPTGISHALIDGADPDKIKAYGKQVYQDKEEGIKWLVAACDYTMIMGVDYAKASFDLLVSTEGGKVKFTDLVFPLENVKLDKLVLFLDKHPCVEKEFTKAVNHLTKKSSSLAELLIKYEKNSTNLF